MFLAYRFNTFDFVNATIFSKSSASFLDQLIRCFFSRNFDMYKFILPTNLNLSKLGLLALHQEILKL